MALHHVLLPLALIPARDRGGGGGWGWLWSNTCIGGVLLSLVVTKASVGPFITDPAL